MTESIPSGGPGETNEPASVGLDCDVCGYDLTGSRISGDCPECGAEINQGLAPIGVRTSVIVLIRLLIVFACLMQLVGLVSSVAQLVAASLGMTVNIWDSAQFRSVIGSRIIPKVFFLLMWVVIWFLVPWIARKIVPEDGVLGRTVRLSPISLLSAGIILIGVTYTVSGLSQLIRLPFTSFWQEMSWDRFAEQGLSQLVTYGFTLAIGLIMVFSKSFRSWLGTGLSRS
ncbi:hypothetical protein [Algisphaera agarilytica]|uniref:Uncharacterized protein n=1 Tax=Algisphaera agarilytica TaxID=1385975 RepID=A0A7X0LMQ5_9BACT|nr:hypothetical protein [Algisphaera agarilytica]MBB6431268.1 hypothetical protein [Algisphaera agarilytica]